MDSSEVSKGDLVRSITVYRHDKPTTVEVLPGTKVRDVARQAARQHNLDDRALCSLVRRPHGTSSVLPYDDPCPLEGEFDLIEAGGLV